jgi:hypothetical protein
MISRRREGAFLMRMVCDACGLPTVPGVTNIQIQVGEAVIGVGDFSMKLTSSPEFFVLCDPCSAYALGYLHYIVQIGGHPALSQLETKSQGSTLDAAA